MLVGEWLLHRTCDHSTSLAPSAPRDAKAQLDRALAQQRDHLRARFAAEAEQRDAAYKDAMRARDAEHIEALQELAGGAMDGVVEASWQWRKEGGALQVPLV